MDTNKQQPPPPPPPPPLYVDLADLVKARGRGCWEAWERIGRCPPLNLHLRGLGPGGWDNLAKEIEARRHVGFLARERLRRELYASDFQYVREAFETVAAAGGQGNGNDLSWLQEACPTAAERLETARQGAADGVAAAWFPWTRKRAVREAWGWIPEYLRLAYLAPNDERASLVQDLTDDVAARVEADLENREIVFNASFPGACNMWAREWLAARAQPARPAPSPPHAEPDLSDLFDDDDEEGGDGPPPSP